jgi:hypothetical protein
MSPSDTNFIKRFHRDVTGKYFFERVIPFGVEYIPVELLTVNEFNKLHRIAYQRPAK